MHESEALVWEWGGAERPALDPLLSFTDAGSLPECGRLL